MLPDNPWLQYQLPGFNPTFTPFSRAAIARGLTEDAIDEGPYYSRSVGAALSGLAPAMHLQGLSGVQLAPGISFAKTDAFNDFVSGVQLHSNVGRWPGVGQGLINQLNRLLSDAAARPNASLIAERLVEDGQAFARAVDQYQGFDFLQYGLFAGRPEAVDRQYYAAMVDLKRWINDTIATLTPAVAAETLAQTVISTVPVSHAEPAHDSTGILDTLLSMIGGRRASPPTEPGQMTTMGSSNVGQNAYGLAAEEPAFPWVPVAIGGGVVLVGAILLLRRG